MNVTGSQCQNCGAGPEYRERHIVNNIYIFDCRRCGYVFHAKDSRGEFRSTFLTRFIRVWRTLTPNVEYLVGSLADAVGVTTELLQRLIKRVEWRSIDGKPQLLEKGHYGITQIIDERTGKATLYYKPHPVVLKDMDPEIGEPWPYDIFHISLTSMEHSPPHINEKIQIKVEVEHCFTRPTEVFIGLEQGGQWVACIQQCVEGGGIKTYTLKTPELKTFGRVNFRIRVFHKEYTWVEDAPSEINLDLMTVKCIACNNIIDLNYVTSTFRCNCGTCYTIKDGRVYALKPDEAFCYDFNRNLAFYWKLRCPNCKAEASLEFDSGRWFCSQCCFYVEPSHDYSFFRCVLPCGHENVYSIFYLVKGKALKCWVCSSETDLPENIKSAWKNCTVFDPFAELAVEGEYFLRKNPGIVPAIVILGPIGIGLGLLAFSASKRVQNRGTA